MTSSSQPSPAGAESVPASAIVQLEMPTPTGPAAPASSPQPASVDAPVSQPAAEVPRDKAGTAFDAARHLNKLHPTSGRWMPKGGRKARASGAPASATPPAPAQSFIPKDAPPPAAEGKSEDKSSAAAPAAVDYSNDAGEVVCRATQLIAGIAFDSPEDCTPAAAEHKNMVSATAAYIRMKGWQASAGVALLLVFAAWLLRILSKPKPQAKVREWLRFTRAQDVTPAAEPQPEPTPSGPSPGSPVIDIPASIPPLAKL